MRPQITLVRLCVLWHLLCLQHISTVVSLHPSSLISHLSSDLSTDLDFQGNHSGRGARTADENLGRNTYCRPG
jgi:hypothetical protein